MSAERYNVLFICTGNSARSIMAEGLMNDMSNGRFKACSAGSHPKSEVHPLALVTLKHFKIPSNGYRSKNWEEFAGPDAPRLDFVVTVCDNAAGEVCPFWPGQPMTAHWGVPDPAAVRGSEEVKARAFLDAAVILQRRIQLMLALPPASLEAVAIQREVRDIGRK